MNYLLIIFCFSFIIFIIILFYLLNKIKKYFYLSSKNHERFLLITDLLNKAEKKIIKRVFESEEIIEEIIKSLELNKIFLNENIKKIKKKYEHEENIDNDG